MAIGIPGAGGGFDYSVLLEKLALIEERPLDLLDDQRKSYKTKLTAYGTLQNVLIGFKSASSALSSTGLFHKLQASATGTNILSASIGTGAVAGSWKVKVDQLAQAQSLASARQSNSNTPVGTGEIKIELGELVGGVFVPAVDKDGNPLGGAVNIAAPKNTMEDIRDAINKNPEMGVNATIVDDGEGKRLVLTSKETGESSTMRVSATDTGGGTGLSDLLTHNPAGASNMEETVEAQNAKFSVNGIPMTRTSNSVTGAIEGVTLSLTGEGESTVTVRGGSKSEITDAVKSFVDAFNKMQAEFTKLTAFDVDEKTSAALNGDSTLRNIRNKIRAQLNTPQEGSNAEGFALLSQIGVEITADGTMKIDDKKLSDALDKNPDAVAKMFSGSAEDAANPDLKEKPGFANQLISLITEIVDTGMLKNAKDGIDSTLKSLDKRFTELATQIEMRIENYRKQFVALDVMMTKMNGTMNYLIQQFDAMNSK